MTVPAQPGPPTPSPIQSPPHSPALECRALSVTYGERAVLRDLDLTVGTSEALALLGPSGCGKTTLLYTVAGFVTPQAGSVSIGGRIVAEGPKALPAEDRDVGVVFQNYALWPHLSALDTVAYPLRRRGVRRSAARTRACELLERMGVGHLAHRRPAQLSGGEQQRVGIARALARDATLYLFDEPTAHLDTALRVVLQEEVAAQRTALGAAVLYATHDVAEAFAVADRVALLRDGAVVQVAPPLEIYERPVDVWAARLTGPASLLDLRVTASDGRGVVDVEIAGRPHTVFVPPTPEHPVPVAGAARAVLRPEWAHLGGEIQGRVIGVRFRGADTDYRLQTPAGTVEIRQRGGPTAQRDALVTWGIDRAWLLATGETGEGEDLPQSTAGSPSPRSAPDPSAPAWS